MFSDYRAFAITQKTILSGGNVAINAYSVTGSTGSFIHIMALEDCVLSNVVLQFPVTIAATDPDTDVNLPAGSQLAGLKSFTHVSGQAEILFFRG